MSTQATPHKFTVDMRIVRAEKLHPLYTRLTLTPDDGSQMPPVKPGQFVNIHVPNAPHTFLRRPISVNKADVEANELTLLIRRAGEGSSILCDMKEGETLNILYPLGNSFTLPAAGESVLLVGGGVGVAPMLCFGLELVRQGFNPEFLLGARRAEDVLELPEFEALGPVHVTTEDGSMGTKGLVTAHSVMSRRFDNICCCGPAPMMKAIAREAVRMGASCQVSLENMMACGLGACLCCVEKTVRGNVCVCTNGPVFNINELTWS